MANEESNYELEQRLKEQRRLEALRKRYPDRIENKEEINPIELVVELATNYFETSPDSARYELSKAVLGSKLGIGINKQGVVCGALIGEYPFIRNGVGVLIIDKQNFEDYQKIMEEREDQKERIETVQEKYPVLAKQIEETEAKLKPYEDKIAEMEKVLQEETELINLKANRLAQLEEENNKKIEEVKGYSSKLIEAKNKNESLEKEKSKIDNELMEILENNNNLIADFQEKQGMIKNKKDKTPEQLVNDKNILLEKELAKKLEECKTYEERLHEEHYTRNKIILGVDIGLIILFLIYVLFFIQIK